MDTDRKLAARAGAGDERAFAELVERHRKPLLRYVARRFRPELAEDAVQEALLSAHRALIGGTRARGRAGVAVDDRVAAGARPRPPRARRAAAGRRRSRLQRAQDPEARAIQAHELGRVVAAFSELPERQRTALAMSALEGRSLEEIGDALRRRAGRGEVARRALAADARRTGSRRPTWTAATRGWRWSPRRCAACASAAR